MEKPDSDQITTERFQILLDNAVSQELPGVTLAVRSRDIDFAGVAGVANNQTVEPLTLEHRFYVASIGKTFLAATIVQLASVLFYTRAAKGKKNSYRSMRSKVLLTWL